MQPTKYVSNFPAMEELIGKMSQSDILIISGFIMLLSRRLDAIVNLIDAGPKQSDNVSSQDSDVAVIKDSSLEIIEDVNKILSLIMNTLSSNSVKKENSEQSTDPVTNKPNEDLREILRQLFPNIDL